MFLAGATELLTIASDLIQSAVKPKKNLAALSKTSDDSFTDSVSATQKTADSFKGNVSLPGRRVFGIEKAIN